MAELELELRRFLSEEIGWLKRFHIPERKKTMIGEMAERTGVWDLKIEEAWGTGYDLCHPIPD